MTNEERKALPQANSVLQRLKAIEDVMSPRNGLGYIETDPSVQEINGEPN